MSGGSAYLYRSNDSSNTLSEMRVCSCTLFILSDTSFSSRKAVMRLSILEQTCGNDSGVSPSKGEAGRPLISIGATTVLAWLWGVEAVMAVRQEHVSSCKAGW
jgi:hypothetical protein